MHLTTRGFAEAEFWFAGIKVVAVILFIIIGFAAIFGLIPMEDQSNAIFNKLSSDRIISCGDCNRICDDDERNFLLSRF